jgi:hypothetical protein
MSSELLNIFLEFKKEYLKNFPNCSKEELEEEYSRFIKLKEIELQNQAKLKELELELKKKELELELEKKKRINKSYRINKNIL